MTPRRQPDRDHEPQWVRVSELIAEQIGLHFPRERFTDLQRGLVGAADELGFDDVAACAEWLLATPLTNTTLLPS